MLQLSTMDVSIPLHGWPIDPLNGTALMQFEARATDEYQRQAGEIPIPGYRIIEPLGKGGFGEVWKCEAPGGLYKAIKFVYGHSNDLIDNSMSGAEQELRALQHVKSLRHPFLLSMDRLECIGNELLIVMELADMSLFDLLQEFRASEELGIPRLDLLMYMRETAEVLDVMNLEHGLQHLDIKPQNLFVVHNHVKVADFGLVNSLAEICAQENSTFELDHITPIYASPESFLGKITLFSDQYSLAVVYQELLTGELPFQGTNFRQLALMHNQTEPNLESLPEADRPFVARALAKDPRARFPSSTDFIRSLITGQMQASTDDSRETSAVGEVNSVTVHELNVPKVSGLSGVHKNVASMNDLCIMDDAREKAKQSGVFPKVPAGKSSADMPGTAPSAPSPPQPSPPIAPSTNVPDSFVDLGGEPPRPSSPQMPGFYQGNPAPNNQGFYGDGFFASETPRTDWPTDLSQYRYVQCLGQSPVGEMWQAEVNGRRCLLKLVNSFAQHGAFGEGSPIEALTRINHPVLQPVTIIPREHNQGIVIVSEAELFPLAQQLKTHPSGMPRQELQSILLDVSETLDELYRGHRIPHLGLNPRTTLLWDETGVQIADFGLVSLFWLPGNQPVAQMNARYAAPELFQGQGTTHSDQYSLALIYHEMLTGVHPFGNASQRQAAQLRSRGEINLDMVPATDREALTQALHPNPTQRFRTTTEFVEALISSAPGSGAEITPWNSSSDNLKRDRGPTSVQAVFADMDSEAIHRTIRHLLRSVVGDLMIGEVGTSSYILQPGKYLEHQCFARMAVSTVPIKLTGFAEEWYAQQVSITEDCFVYRVPLKTSFWQKCLGSQPAVELALQVMPPREYRDMTEMRVLIRPHNCNQQQSITALEELSPALLESLRNHLQAGAERRRHIRFPMNMPVQYRAVQSDNSLGDPLVGQGKDISKRGMGLYLPCKPPQEYLVLQLQGSPEEPMVSVPAQVRHAHVMGDGRYEVGVKFIRD